MLAPSNTKITLLCGAVTLWLSACGLSSTAQDLFGGGGGAGGATAGVTSTSTSGTTSSSTSATTTSATTATSTSATTTSASTTSATTTSATTSATTTSVTSVTSVTSTSSGGPTVVVSCADQPCDAGQICCFDAQNGNNSHCGAEGTCDGNAIEISCNGPEDCPGATCCGDWNGAYTGIYCQDSCQGIIMCNGDPSVCPNGPQSCHNSQILGQGYKFCQ